MEKNIATRDLSDMMVYEGMHAQSKELYKQAIDPIRRLIDKCFSALASGARSVTKMFETSDNAAQRIDFDYGNTAVAAYTIAAASVVISFFWLTLLTTI